MNVATLEFGRRSGDWRYRILRYACAMIGVPYFRPRVEFSGALPLGPFIVACNHATLLDWAAVAHFIPRPVRFLITREYYDLRGCNWFCRWGGAIPVRAGAIEPSAIRLALAALARGEVVGIFPEGGITRDGNLLRFQRGVAQLALRAGCPIVPATIRGAFDVFPHHRRLPRPRRVVVAFGHALFPRPASANSSDRRPVEGALLRELQLRIMRLAEEPCGALVGTAKSNSAASAGAGEPS